MRPIDAFLAEVQTNHSHIWETPQLIKRNEFISRPGQQEAHTYFVQSGVIRVFYVSESEEHTIRFGYANDFITDLPAYLSGKATQLYLQAIKETTIVPIKKKHLTNLINSKPAYQQLWQSLLEDLVLQQFDREIDLLTSSPVERYKRVLERSPQLFQEVPSRYIANYLRMSPETLSRLKK